MAIHSKASALVVGDNFVYNFNNNNIKYCDIKLKGIIMAIFRKKAIEVEAKQFTEQNKDQIYHWAREIQNNIFPSRSSIGESLLMIPTLQGDMECAIGDWLIVEISLTGERKIYPCKGAIFEQTYEEIK